MASNNEESRPRVTEFSVPSLADLWTTSYKVEHRRFRVLTEDGVSIAGVHLDRQDSDTLVLYAHGFLANKDHMRVPRFVEALAGYYDVMAIDLRGHGESGGGSTFGALEVFDIQATVEYARSLGYRRITTIGSSMGGASVLRHAAIFKSQEGVVTIGAFADGSDIGWPNSDLGVHFLYHSGRLGELWSYVTRGTRLDRRVEHQSPLQLVGEIAPIPLLLIHGERDRMVHPRSARLLFEAANEPKELILVPRAGHDHPHLTADTVALVREWMERHGLNG